MSDSVQMFGVQGRGMNNFDALIFGHHDGGVPTARINQNFVALFYKFTGQLPLHGVQYRRRWPECLFVRSWLYA